MGGDPLHPVNRDFTREFCKQMKDELDICIYTGYLFCEVVDFNITGYKFLKTGTYMETEKQTVLKLDEKMVFASTNQKLYDEKNTILTLSGVYKYD